MQKSCRTKNKDYLKSTFIYRHNCNKCTVISSQKLTKHVLRNLTYWQIKVLHWVVVFSIEILAGGNLSLVLSLLEVEENTLNGVNVQLNLIKMKLPNCHGAPQDYTLFHEGMKNNGIFKNSSSHIRGLQCNWTEGPHEEQFATTGRGSVIYFRRIFDFILYPF